MIHVSRVGWGARPPDSTTPLDRSRVDKFIVHYSGASRDQTVRSIQNFCMDDKGHVDIDYNRIVHGDYDYMGRGWNVGGHTLNNNSTSYGVCVIGQDGDATDADFRTVRGIYDEVCASLGRQLVKTTHRGVLGVGYTSCPGLKLHNWVMAGMPSVPLGDDDMLNSDQDAALSIAWEDAEALTLGLDTTPARQRPHWLVGQVKAMQAKLDALDAPAPVEIDPAVLKTVLLDPVVLAAFAKAITDEIGT